VIRGYGVNRRLPDLPEKISTTSDPFWQHSHRTGASHLFLNIYSIAEDGFDPE